MKGGEHGAGVCEELRCERMWLGGGGDTGWRLGGLCLSCLGTEVRGGRPWGRSHVN